MSGYRFSTLAATDLRNIRIYISHDSVDRAATVIESIRTACDLLAKWPRLGRPREELGDGVRSYAAGDYVIYYRELSGVVEVSRVLHGARDTRESLGD